MASPSRSLLPKEPPTGNSHLPQITSSDFVLDRQIHLVYPSNYKILKQWVEVPWSLWNTHKVPGTP